MTRPEPMFRCEKQPATGSRGMVVTNHPLASAAAAEVLLAGGNAVDAAVTGLFALSVVEPMMVGLLGGGVAHIRLADGRHTIVDGLSTAPGAADAAMFDAAAVTARANLVGARAVAVPGALAGWCCALAQYGTLALADAVAPAIRLAERGFAVTPYLADCITDTATDIATDSVLAAMFLPGGGPLAAGARLRRPDYADSLRLVAQGGAAALYDGELGAAVVAHLAARGGVLASADLAGYRVVERAPVWGSYRGFDVAGPPPPSSGGVHIVQMLNLLAGYDVAAMGFGSADAAHLLAEVLKIAFADRAVATADPAFVAVPVARLIDPAYAEQRRADIDMAHAQAWGPGIARPESAGKGGPNKEGADTTHVTVADADGNVVASTQTINGLFGACVAVPGTGLLANNYMGNFDPLPGRALSIAPGKRVFTSMAPMLALRDGRLAWALGLPGGLRIFGSAMQALVNLIDHGMTLQQAVEAPRLWTMGGALELEAGFPESTEAALRSRGHDVQRVRRVAGGMNAIGWDGGGIMTGAACWRADGTPVGIAGGLARAGVRFSL